MSTSEEKSIVLKRLALTGMDVLSGLDVETYPELRSAHARRNIDLYDEQLAEVIRVLTRTAKLEHSPDYYVEKTRLKERMANQIRCINNVKDAVRLLPSIRLTSDFSDYIKASRLDLRRRLIRLGKFSFDDNVTNRGVGRHTITAAELSDVVSELLNLATSTKGKVNKTYRVPAAMQDKLRHQEAIDELLKMIPPFSSVQKRGFIRSFYELGFGDEKELPKASEFHKAYEKALSNWSSNLKGGVFTFGGAGTVQSNVTSSGREVNTLKSYSLASGKDKLYDWELIVNLFKDHIEVMYRFALSSAAVKRLAQKWMKGSEKAMLEEAGLPEAKLQYAVDEANLLLNLNHDKFYRRTTYKAELYPKVFISKQKDKQKDVILKVEVARSTEIDIPSNRKDLDAILLRIYSTNKELLGTRKTTEAIAGAIAKHYGWALSGVVETSSRSDNLVKYGFDITWNMGKIINSNNILSAVDALTDTIGTQKDREAPEDFEEKMQAFESKWGIQRGKFKGKDALKRMLGLRVIPDLTKRINFIIDNGVMAIPKNTKKQLESIKKSLEKGLFKDPIYHHIVIPAQLEKLELIIDEVRQAKKKGKAKQGKTAAASTLVDEGSNLPQVFRKHLDKHLVSMNGALSHRLKLAGVSKPPVRADIISAFVAQSAMDFERHGMVGRSMIVSMPQGAGIEDRKIAEFGCSDGSGLSVYTNSGMLTFELSHLPLLCC